MIYGASVYCCEEAFFSAWNDDVEVLFLFSGREVEVEFMRGICCVSFAFTLRRERNNNE